MKFTIIAALLFSANAYAGNVSALVMGFSKHLRSSPYGYNYNEVNLGLGVEYAKNGIVGRVGVYRDSYYKAASFAFVGYRFTVGSQKGLNADLTLNAGYLDGSGNNGFLAFPSFAVGYKKLSVEFTYKPKTDEKPVDAVAAMFRYNF